MAKAKRKRDTNKQIRRPDLAALKTARAKRAGSNFDWHSGRITRLGHHETAGRSISIAWDEGGVTSQQGDISDEVWEIFKLALQTTGRIAILSDEDGENWTYDYRFLEVMT